MENMKLIVNLKLKPLPIQHHALLATIKQTNKACNWISEQAFRSKTYSQFYLHKIVYKSAREMFNLSAQIIVRAIAKVADSYKLQTKTRSTFKQLGSIAYDDRILTFKQNEVVSLWTVEGRMNIGFVCGEHQRSLLPFRKGEIDLIYRKGEFYLNAVCEVEEPEKLGFDDILGVDFGITNLAVDSAGEPFSGKEVEQVREKYCELRQILQHKASKQSKGGKRPRSIHRFLKSVGKKERSFRRHQNHCLSKKLVEKAKTQKCALALEDLKGIRQHTEKRFRKSQRAKMSGWSFFELKEFVAYKSKLHGVQLFLVDPRNTSRTCSECGYCDKDNRKSQAEFLCLSCGHHDSADFNAAKNIRGRAKRNLARRIGNRCVKGRIVSTGSKAPIYNRFGLVGVGYNSNFVFKSLSEINHIDFIRINCSCFI